MDEVIGFEIIKLENGFYAIQGNSVYQDIDFISGGYIQTAEKAIEIREILISDYIANKEETSGELKSESELTIKQLDDKITDIQLAIVELVEMNLGGM